MNLKLENTSMWYHLCFLDTDYKTQIEVKIRANFEYGTYICTVSRNKYILGETTIQAKQRTVTWIAKEAIDQYSAEIQRLNDGGMIKDNY